MAYQKNMQTAARVALALTLATVLAACSRSVPTLSGAATAGVGSGKASGPAAPYSEVYPEEQPQMPELDPAEGPVNLPPIPRAPTSPVAPSNMQIKALAMTLSQNPARGMGDFRVDIIRARITWTPVKGAAGYKVYQLESVDGTAEEGQKGKLMFTTPKWLPAAIVGGGLAGMGNLKVGQGYVYTVDAVDRAGNVIASGQDNCAPLAPLAIPRLELPAQNQTNVGQDPFFRWAPSRGADGYYVEVFSTIRATMPALPMWRAFREGQESMNIQYGQTVDVFEGTKPLQWMLPLNIGQRYGWTVCAIRTDTHNMHQAKAIAKATAPMNFFLP